jgi:surface antigen
MSRTLKSLGAGALVALMLAVGGCAPNPDYGTKQIGGALLGGGLGALAGSTIGSGRGRVVAAGVGGVLGAMLGSEVGRSLDRADQAAHQQATYRALEYEPAGSRVGWSNPQNGNAGYVTPTRTYQTQAQQVCREYETTIYVGGRAETGTGTACREADGRWRIV